MVMSRKCVPPLLLHSSMSPATDTDRYSLQSIVKAQGAITNYRPFVELAEFLSANLTFHSQPVQVASTILHHISTFVSHISLSLVLSSFTTSCFFGSRASSQSPLSLLCARSLSPFNRGFPPLSIPQSMKEIQGHQST